MNNDEKNFNRSRFAELGFRCGQCVKFDTNNCPHRKADWPIHPERVNEACNHFGPKTQAMPGAVELARRLSSTMRSRGCTYWHYDQMDDIGKMNVENYMNAALFVLKDWLICEPSTTDEG